MSQEEITLGEGTITTWPILAKQMAEQRKRLTDALDIFETWSYGDPHPVGPDIYQNMVHSLWSQANMVEHVTEMLKGPGRHEPTDSGIQASGEREAGDYVGGTVDGL